MKTLQIFLAGLTGLACVAVGAVGAVVTPRFAEAFADLGVAVPGLTQFILRVPFLGYLAGGLVAGGVAATLIGVVRPPGLSIGVFFAVLLLLVLTMGTLYAGLMLPLTETMAGL